MKTSLLILTAVLTVGCHQRNETPVTQQKNENRVSPFEMERRRLREYDRTHPVDSVIVPGLSWNMTTERIKELGGTYALGREKEWFETSGILIYEFDRMIDAVGTYGSFTYFFPSQYDSLGSIVAEFSECATPAMIDGDIRMSRDCRAIERRLIEHFSKRFGKPLVSTELNKGGGTDTHYQWYSPSSRIKLTNLGDLTMAVEFRPR